MIPALFSIVIGVLLLGLLAYWASRGSSSAPGAGSPAGKSEALQLDLLPADLIERILDPRDLDFVCKESGGETARLFERERRMLAISWLQHTRRHMARLMSYHVRAVRQNINFQPMLEIRLALHYVNFLVAYELALGLFYVLSPFEVRPFVGHLTDVTARICGVSDKLLREVSVAGSPPNSAVGGR